MGGEAAFLLLRESFGLADVSLLPLHLNYLWYPYEETGESPSSLLQGGCAPTMAAIEQGWVWPNSSHTSAWQGQGRLLVCKMLYKDFCTWYQVLLTVS